MYTARNNTNNTGQFFRPDYLDTVGVAGSIPVEPTIKKEKARISRRCGPGLFPFFPFQAVTHPRFSYFRCEKSVISRGVV